jgi:hypothetical protein
MSLSDSLTVGGASFTTRYRERLEREHAAARTALVAEVAGLRLKRAEEAADGIWVVGDAHLEAAEARLAKLDQAWAASALEWDVAMVAAAKLRAGWAAARERAADPAFVAAVEAATGIAELEQMLREGD